MYRFVTCLFWALVFYAVFFCCIQLRWHWLFNMKVQRPKKLKGKVLTAYQKVAIAYMDEFNKLADSDEDWYTVHEICAYGLCNAFTQLTDYIFKELEPEICAKTSNEFAGYVWPPVGWYKNRTRLSKLQALQYRIEFLRCRIDRKPYTFNTEIFKDATS